MEFLENGSIPDHEILHAYQGQAAPQTCQKRRHQLLLVGCQMLLNTTDQTSVQNGSEMPKKAYNSEILRDTAKDKCTAASGASSNFSSEEYRHSFQIKRRGVSPCPTLWWASCYYNKRLSIVSIHGIGT